MVAHREHAPHLAASTMKTALVIAAFREAEAGRVDLDAPVVVHNLFASVVRSGCFGLNESYDSDPLPWRRQGELASLRWLAYRALVRSSNLATNLLLEAVGFEPVAAALGAVGARESMVVRGIEDGAARAAGRENIVTAHDLALTLQALVGGTAAARESCDEILAVLAAQQINDGIPAGLPAGTRVAHKSGWVEGVSHDAGIVYPDDAPAFVVVVCTSSGLSAQAGLDHVANGARAAWMDRHRIGSR